jgi:hypothetical protein
MDTMSESGTSCPKRLDTPSAAIGDLRERRENMASKTSLAESAGFACSPGCRARGHLEVV